MRFVAGIWRLAIVALCVMGTSEAWTQPNRWVYFTFQTGALVGFVMLWAGAASLVRGVQPPAWLKGAATTYAIVVALVAFTMLPAGGGAPGATAGLNGPPASLASGAAVGLVDRALPEHPLAK